MLHSYFIKVENFGQENFGESLVIRQICQNILPPKFCLIQYLLGLGQLYPSILMG